MDITGINTLVVWYGDQNGDTKTIIIKYNDQNYIVLTMCQIHLWYVAAGIRLALHTI